MTTFDLPLAALRWNGHNPMTAGRSTQMPKFGMKAVLTAFTLSRSRQQRPDWERVIIIFSTAVTVGLVAAYLYGKATSRW
jgi:hypothetical protein